MDGVHGKAMVCKVKKYQHLRYIDIAHISMHLPLSQCLLSITKYLNDMHVS